MIQVIEEDTYIHTYGVRADMSTTFGSICAYLRRLESPTFGPLCPNTFSGLNRVVDIDEAMFQAKLAGKMFTQSLDAIALSSVVTC
jgi:hypothetical protein